MCFFPLSNTNHNSDAWKAGLQSFECGHCPECARKRSNRLALRDFYEAKDHAFNCMVCLTYDTAVYDKYGRKIGEKLPPSDLRVNKRDVQLFIKRLRKYFSGIRIKYRAAAEYGPHTGRPHYHVILFGVRFSDYRFYKKSKRGNPLYTSPTLTKLWGHGICTIDALSLSMAASFYASKYTAKDQRNSDTFMLCSQNIGLSSMITEFNGVSYRIGDREFSIPREVWQHIISARYGKLFREFDYRYKNRQDCSRSEFLYNEKQRARYRRLRNDDFQYRQYLAYWKRKGEHFDKFKLSWNQRLALLPDDKYFAYKLAATRTRIDRMRAFSCKVELTDPRSPVYERRRLLRYLYYFPKDFGVEDRIKVTCPFPSRLKRASDTKAIPYRKKYEIFDNDGSLDPFSIQKKVGIQQSFFDEST